MDIGVIEDPVDRAGIRLPGGLGHAALDVLLDDVWVWSFDPARDGRVLPGRKGTVEVPWPTLLRQRLDGRSRVRVVEHDGEQTLVDVEVAFTETDRRVEIVDQHGHHLSIDKAGRFQRKFGDAEESMRGYLIDEVNRILADLRERAGLEAFLGYGCLLGAVRDGKMIGHDADADLIYLSRAEHPFDLIRENRAALAVMRSLGYRIVEMSGADFKIWVHLPDGRRTGVDVFGGYFFGGRYHQLGSVRGQLSREDLLPPSTVRLEGRTVIAPARPEAMLELCYGPGWRVPDPSFRYAHPRDITRHMDGYWRGQSFGRRTWDTYYRGAEGRLGDRRPSEFARWVQRYTARRGEPDIEIVDVGTGLGSDAAFFARRGHPVRAVDFSHGARVRLHKRFKNNPEVRTGSLNLNDGRSVLSLGARLAFTGTARHVYARRLVEAIGPKAREELYRFYSMVTRRGGALFLEIGDPGAPPMNDRRMAGTASQLAATVVDEVGRRGWLVHDQQSLLDPDHPDTERTAAVTERARVVRLVIERPSEGSPA